MLTIDFDKLALRPGQRLLDLGCGDGRHAYAANRAGADVTALDMDDVALKGIHNDTEHPGLATVRADGRMLPFTDNAFDHVVISEVLEHVPDDRALLTEAARVLAPGGLLSISVPRWFPERVCWTLSRSYHQVDGGHIRIYRRSQLLKQVAKTGLHPLGTHHAHALHSPYWWLKCLVGIDHDNALVHRYHDFLCHEITNGPWPNPRIERMLNVVLGKSLVLYARKPDTPT
ncbi:SAM-dependent methyltransferase [Amycolatopsis antarctica]|uniref:SAM-dependent methyltransferase n=1 Tax=Amycolatopsis antarctica TaxID=1854586 RepID=A0A263D212_9PSEU|nr:class I SAM-dependent methyltransferase [Amycolatopsis antarctica]OZM72118.1 SAM-dependent methyltransferase [Amycolatopsis antarctica]